MQDLQAYITEADLNKDLALVASLCGIETAQRLMLECRGLNLYVPSGLPKAVMSRYARDAYANGMTAKQISRVLRVSERYVQNLLQPPTPTDEQTQMLLSDDL